MACWVNSRQAAKERGLTGSGGLVQAMVKPGSGGGAEVETWTLSGPRQPLSSCSKSNTQVQGWGTKWRRAGFGRHRWREERKMRRGQKGTVLGLLSSCRRSLSPGYVAASKTHLNTTLQQDVLLPSSSLGAFCSPIKQNPTGTHRSLQSHAKNTKHL